MSTVDFLSLFTLAALWGGSFLFMHIAGPALGPFVTAELRVGFATLALLVYSALIRHRPAVFHHWKVFLLLGAANAAIPFVLITTAELTIPSSLASILNATTPVFTALIAWMWLKEPLGFKKITGLLAGIIGVMVLVGWSPVPVNQKILLSVTLSLAAALFYGIAGIYASKASKGIKAIDLAIGQQLSATLWLLPFALFSFHNATPTKAALFSVLGLAILSTAIAYLIYFRLINSIGPVKTLSVTFLVPIFGVLWGFIFLKESVNSATFIGMGIIFIGIMFVTNSFPRLSGLVSRKAISSKPSLPKTNPGDFE